MKVMRFSLIFLFISLISTTILQAQPGRGERGSSPLEKLKKEITLTEEQEAEIKVIMDEYREDMKALRQQSFENPAARKDAFEALVKAQWEAIEAILTEEQKATLAEKREARQQEMEARKEEMAARREQFKALQKAIKAYQEEEILPVLLAQRAKLEPQISAEDKATIDELREKMKEKKEALQNRSEQGAQKGRKFGRNSGKRGKKPGQRDQANRQAKEDRKQMHELIKAYKENIDVLYEEISAQREQWKTDLKNLREQYISSDENNDRRSRGRHSRQGPPNRSRDMQRGERENHLNYGHFLLLEPTDTEEGAQILPTTPEIKLNVFPNPTANTNTLQYKLEQPGQIRIELHDEKGKLLKTVFTGFQETGDYSQLVDVSELNPGVYYYTIKSPRGVSSVKMVIAQ